MDPNNSVIKSLWCNKLGILCESSASKTLYEKNML